MPRLFVGGLSGEVDVGALKERFGQYGSITNVDLKEKKDMDGNVMMRFAFVNLDSDSGRIQDCVRANSGASWCGSQLRVEVAKESFLDRLNRERAEAQRAKEDDDPWTAGKKGARNDNWQGNRDGGDNRRNGWKDGEQNDRFGRQNDRFGRQNNWNDRDQNDRFGRQNNWKDKDQNDRFGRQNWNKTDQNDNFGRQNNWNDRDQNDRFGRQNWNNRDQNDRFGRQKQETDNMDGNKWTGDNKEDPSKPMRKNAEEEAMMSSFKNFSSVWADSDEEKEEVDTTTTTTTPTTSAAATNTTSNGVRAEVRGQLSILDKLKESDPSRKRLRATFSADSSSQGMTRYDPSMEISVPKRRRNKQAQEEAEATETKPEAAEATEKYVKISDGLSFKESSGGFSFLTQFTAQTDQGGDEEDVVKDEPERVVQPARPAKPVARPAPKARPFFLTPGDAQLQSAVTWMVQGVTEEVRKDFFRAQHDLRELISNRSSRAARSERDTRRKGGAARQWDEATVSLVKDHRWREAHHRH